MIGKIEIKKNIAKKIVRKSKELQDLIDVVNKVYIVFGIEGDTLRIFNKRIYLKKDIEDRQLLDSIKKIVSDYINDKKNIELLELEIKTSENLREIIETLKKYKEHIETELIFDYSVTNIANIELLIKTGFSFRTEPIAEYYLLEKPLESYIKNDMFLKGLSERLLLLLL